MFNRNSITYILILFTVFSCQKEAKEMHHFVSMYQKIINQDAKAFVGDWERVEMTTWDYQDKSVSDFSSEKLKITKNHWITAGIKREYSMKIYPTECGIMATELWLETDGKKIIVPFSTHEWQHQLRFKVFEYPDNPKIFRIDKLYKPAGYPN